jgi:hypothetical protein
LPCLPRQCLRSPDAAQHPCSHCAHPAQPDALFLTILGIVIGVSAVITMVTLGNGATLAVQNQISGLGTNLLQVRPGQRMGPGGGSGAPAFKDTDADAIAQQIGGILAVAPEARAGATVVAGGRNWTTSIIGSTNAWLQTGNWAVRTGRVFSDAELRAGAAVCLIGETVRRELYGTRDAVGEQLRVKAFSCEVVGVLASKGQGAFGNDQDDTVVVPLRTLQRRVTGNTRVNTLLVSMQDGSDPERVKASLTQRKRAASCPTPMKTTSMCLTPNSWPTRCQAPQVLTRCWARWQYGHHEHHAGQRDRTHPRNGLRLAIGAPRGTSAVSDRGRSAGCPGWADRHCAGHGGIDRPVGPDESALHLQPWRQPAVVLFLGRDRRVVWLFSGPPRGAHGPD